MNPDLLSNTVSLALLAIVALLLLAHLSRLTGAHRLRHAVDALTCAGLIYLFGMRAFGWGVAPRPALCAAFALLAVAVAVYGLVREARGQEVGLPWRLTSAQAAAMAYVFGPFSLWKPAVSFLLLLFFALETARWLAGTEEDLSDSQQASPHPPLFPPKRTRGVREVALAGTAAVLAGVFAMGTGRAPLTPLPETEEPAAEAVAEPPPPSETASAASEAPASSETTTASPEAPSSSEPTTASPEAATASAAPVSQPSPQSGGAIPGTYTTVAGDTFKTIAKKLYGAPEKWRSLAAANPKLKPGAKFKAGVTIRLSEPRAVN